jgi:hypothetical protein
MSTLARFSLASLLSLVVLALVISGCGTPPPKPKPVATKPKPKPRLDVRVVVHAAGHLDVDYRLPLGWLPQSPKTVSLRFFDQPEFTTGKRRYVEFITLHGSKRPFPPSFALPGSRLRGGLFRVRYRVDLTHHLAKPRHGRDDVPHPTAKGWHLLGRAFLPKQIVLDGNKRVSLRGRLVFSLPSGWKMTSTFGRDDTTFDGILAKMVDAVYHVGRFARREVKRGGAVVELVSGDFSAAELAPLAALTRGALAEGERLLGKLDQRRLLVVFDRDPNGFQGGVINGTVTLTSAVAPLASAMAPTGVVLTHELMHLWNRADRFWLNEGMARYLELLLKLRLDAATPTHAVAELLSLYRVYLRRAAGGKVIAKANGPLAYDGGAIALFCADAELRAAKAGTLFDVHRAARLATAAKVRSRPGWIQTPRFFAELKRRSPKVAAALRSRLDAATTIDLGPCLRAAGYIPRLRRYRGFAKHVLQSQVLRVTRLTSFGLRVLELGPDSKLKVGDVLLAVNGRAVTRVHQLESAFASAGKGVTLKLLRDGKEQTIGLALPKLSASQRPSKLGLAPLSTAGAAQRSPLEAR